MVIWQEVGKLVPIVPTTHGLGSVVMVIPLPTNRDFKPALADICLFTLTLLGFSLILNVMVS